MNCLFLILFFAFCPLFRIAFFSQLSSSAEIDNDALVAFVKGPSNFVQFCAAKGVANNESKGLLARVYGTHLGMLYHMRLNWHCAITNNSIHRMLYKRKCEYFRKSVDILYEYLSRVHNGGNAEVTRPIFKAESTSIQLTFVEVVECLATISNFYFCDQKMTNDYEIMKEMAKFSQFKLENEEQQLDFKSGKSAKQKNKRLKTDGKANGIEFEQKMEKMFRKIIIENAKLANGSSSSAFSSSTFPSSAFPLPISMCTVPIYDAALRVPIYDMSDAIEEELFLKFVNGSADFSTHFAAVPSNKIKKYETHLGLLYAMKTNWRCANAKNKIDNSCTKDRRYIDILYEYLFMIRYGIKSVKPMFETLVGQRPVSQSLMNVVHLLGTISKYYATGYENAEGKALPNEPFKLKLTNENELLNYGAKSAAENSKLAFEENILKMAFDGNDATKGRQPSAARLEGLLRQKFYKELETMFEKRVKKKKPSDEA